MCEPLPLCRSRACLLISTVSMTTFSLLSMQAHLASNSSSYPMPLTQLCPLKLGQLCQSLRLASDLLYRLTALEARKSREVGVVLVDQIVVSKRQLRVLRARFFDASEQFVCGGGTESGGRGHLAQLEVTGGFFIARGFGAAARSLRKVGEAGHGCEGRMCLEVGCDCDVSRVQHWGNMLERWYLRLR